MTLKKRNLLIIAAVLLLIGTALLLIRRRTSVGLQEAGVAAESFSDAARPVVTIDGQRVAIPANEASSLDLNGVRLRDVSLSQVDAIEGRGQTSVLKLSDGSERRVSPAQVDSLADDLALRITYERDD